MEGASLISDECISLINGCWLRVISVGWGTHQDVCKDTILCMFLLVHQQNKILQTQIKSWIRIEKACYLQRDVCEDAGEEGEEFA